jgi:hypothetical protein
LIVEEGAVAKTSFWDAGMGEAGVLGMQIQFAPHDVSQTKIRVCNFCAFGEAVGLA